MKRALLPTAILMLGALSALPQSSAPDGKRGDAQPRPAQTLERTLKVGAQTRTYLLHLPPGAAGENPMPLVVCLHGAGGTGKIQEALSGFDAVADRHHFAVAYPDGRKRMWVYMDAKDLLGRDLPGEDRGFDDSGFLMGLADDLVRTGIADKRRIYFTGISNGAYMSNKMGCEHADRIAAIAPVSGTMPHRLADTARPKRPLPVLYMHGTEDSMVGYDGKDRFSRRGFSLPAEELVAWWAKKNGAAEKPTVEKLPDAEKDDTTVERRTHAAGEKSAPVVFYKITGGGHTWPGGSVQPEGMLGNVCRDINASEVIWEFFSKHALPEEAKDDTK